MLKNHKSNLISLKKPNPNNNNSNNFLPRSSKSIYYQNYNKDNGPKYLLPLIDKTIITKAYHRPTSILTKYITYYSNGLIKKAQENIKKPAILEEIERRTTLNSLKYKKEFQQKRQSRSKTLPNEFLPVEVKKVKKSLKDKLYLTEQENQIKNQIKNQNQSKIPVPNQNHNQSQIQNKSCSDSNNNNSKVSKVNEKEPSNKSKTDAQNNLTTDFNVAQFYNNLGIKKRIDSSVTIGRELNKDKLKFLETNFRRIRTYQPKIDENWKTAYGLTNKIGTKVPKPRMYGNIDYQCKLLNDQFKLLMENIQFYKMNIIGKDLFFNAFKFLSLKDKISLNKALEEACGLLLLLPKLILLEFYKYIEKFDNLSIPDKRKFKDKYIFDEVSCLYYNDNLLSEVSEFFKNCFEVYLTLVKEVDDMSLKEKNFKNAITAFEKARFDIGLAINIGENAMDTFKEDVSVINKLNRKMMAKNAFNGNIFNLKFNSLKKNKYLNNDRQRRLRIETCLSNKDDDNTNYNEFMFTRLNKAPNSKKFKSIVNSDLMNKILKHCKKEVKQKITTQRMNDEFDESISGEDELINKYTHKVMKLNF